MDESRLLDRITVNPQIFGGKPILRGRRLAVEHVLAMLAAGDTAEAILKGYHGWNRRTSRPASSMPGGLRPTNELNLCPSRLRLEGPPGYVYVRPGARCADGGWT